MEKDKKKVVLVTGGTKGIGRSIALLLLKNHYNTLITYSNDDVSAKAMKNESTKIGYSNFHIIKADVSKKENTIKLISIAKERWNASISYVVNNAGILKQGNFFDLKNEEWDKTFSVNLKGVFYLWKRPGKVRAFFIGGGESRTLVLSKLYISLYMFRTPLYNRPCCRARHLGPRVTSIS